MFLYHQLKLSCKYLGYMIHSSPLFYYFTVNMIKYILISVVRLLLLQFVENDTLLLLMSFFSYLCIIELNFLKLSLQAVRIGNKFRIRKKKVVSFVLCLNMVSLCFSNFGNRSKRTGLFKWGAICSIQITCQGHMIFIKITTVLFLCRKNPSRSASRSGSRQTSRDPSPTRTQMPGHHDTRIRTGSASAMGGKMFG